MEKHEQLSEKVQQEVCKLQTRGDIQGLEAYEQQCVANGAFDDAVFALCATADMADTAHNIELNRTVFKKFRKYAAVYADVLRDAAKAMQCCRRAEEVYKAFGGELDRGYLAELVQLYSDMEILARRCEEEDSLWTLKKTIYEKLMREADFEHRAQQLRSDCNMLCGLLQNGADTDSMKELYRDIQRKYQTLCMIFSYQQYSRLYLKYQVQQNTSAVTAAWKLYNACKDGK